MTRRIAAFIVSVVFLSCSKQEPPPPSGRLVKNGQNTAIEIDADTVKQLDLEVTPVSASSVGATITATGQLQVNENKTWKVGSVIEGKIVSVSANLGETVQAGEVVAQMHSHEVHDARATRRQAIAELNRLKILTEQALRVRDRTQRLYHLKAASREQMEAAETQYRSAQLSVATAQAEVEKADFHLTEFLEVPLTDKGSPGGTVIEADRIPIKTPATGTVMERLANVGTVVSIGDPVLTVSDLSSLWLIAAINEAELSFIRPGQPVRISVRAYPDRTFTGKVFQLGERMDPQTRTLQVRVLVSNTGGLLKPEMFATVELNAPSQGSALYLPEAAIQDLHGKTVVFVRTDTGAFLPREVRLGRRLDGRVEIVSGLLPGTPVVTRGSLLLKSQLLKEAE